MILQTGISRGTYAVLLNRGVHEAVASVLALLNTYTWSIRICEFFASLNSVSFRGEIMGSQILVAPFSIGSKNQFNCEKTKSYHFQHHFCLKKIYNQQTCKITLLAERIYFLQKAVNDGKFSGVETHVFVVKHNRYQYRLIYALLVS